MINIQFVFSVISRMGRRRKFSEVEVAPATLAPLLQICERADQHTITEVLGLL